MALEVWPLLLSGALGIRCLVEVFTRRRRIGKRCSCSSSCRSSCIPARKSRARSVCRAPVTRQEDATSPTCPLGHVLTIDRHTGDVVVGCDVCKADIPGGVTFFSSPASNYDLCQACYNAKDRANQRASGQPATQLALLDAADGAASLISEDAAKQHTVMARLGTSCLEAQICSESGVLEDVSMQGLLEMAKAYTQLLSLLGTSASMVLWDFEKNLVVVKQLCEKDPQARRTLSCFLQAELDSGGHTPGPGDKCKLRDPSGACSLQWMIRSLHFFVTMIQLSIVEDVSDAADRAYQQTLKPYHGFMASLGFKAALMGMPGRNDILSLKELCPMFANDTTKLAGIISRDCKQTTSVVLPTLEFLIASSRQRGLWSDRTV